MNTPRNSIGKARFRFRFESLIVGAVMIVFMTMRMGMAEATPRTFEEIREKCNALKKTVKELEDASLKAKLTEATKMLDSLPVVSSTDPETVENALDRDVVDAWENYFRWPPQCSDVRVKIVRNLVKAGQQEGTSDADKEKLRALAVRTLTHPHGRTIIESMSSLGLLKEAVDSGLLPFDKGAKEQIETELAQAKLAVKKISNDLENAVKGTPLSATESGLQPADVRKFLTDPKNVHTMEKFKSVLKSEIKLAHEVRGSVEKFVATKRSSIKI